MKTGPDLLQQFLDVEGELLKPRYQIKTFDCPARFLSGENENQALAQAYFASLDRQPAGPGIDDLVKNGYIPQQLIEHAREMRGTPAYEKYRRGPPVCRGHGPAGGRTRNLQPAGSHRPGEAAVDGGAS